MTTPEPKRMAQACRMYDALLRYYPLSFQQEYGEPLAAYFRDEYHDVLASGKRLAVFRFWLFIIFDFLSSLLMEVQEEVFKMFKKNFFVFCAIAVGMVTLYMSLLSDGRSYKYIHDILNISDFFEVSIWFLYFGLSSLTLFGVIKTIHKNLLFRIPPLVVLIASFSLLPVPQKHSWRRTWDWNWLFSTLGMDGENAIRVINITLFILILIIGIVALVRRKWLPGAALIMMVAFPWGFPTLIYWLSTMIPSLGRIDNDWRLFLNGSLFVAVWFVIAGWLWMENKEPAVNKLPDELEPA